MNKFIESFADYLGKLKRVDLFSDLETNKTELYRNIVELFNEKKDSLELYFLTDFRNLNIVDRGSMWKFKTGGRLDLIESKRLPIISLELIGENYLKNKADFLVREIKENLGVELSYNY